MTGQHAATRPLVLLCECAGTLSNIDFDRLEQHAALQADVVRGTHWCSRVGQAQMLELMESGTEGGRQLVFAGCSADFAARRFQKLMARGLQLGIADIREGCSWVHGNDIEAVTDKAARIVDASVAYPDAPADTVSYAERHDTVVVIGGGVAGTQAAAELAQMGHHVELVERRPFLGGRAARIGTVFPTNDCGQCLPTTDAQAGTRKCFHRNVAIDHPNLSIHRRSTVEAVTGHPGDFQVSIRTLPNIVTDACINCGTCETVCEAEASEPGKKAIFTEFYDGRVIRTVDLETCTFCGKCAGECPVEAIDFAQSPRRTTVNAGAILTATGCEPAPPKYYDYLGYDGDKVVTQVELAEMLDDWTAQAALGCMPVEDLVMVQCAGSRDQRHLPHCSRLCCMIALKHATRLKALFPQMKVTICYLEMRTAGVGYENWFLEARRAGVEFLRGTPPEVQYDASGRPVIEVEDVTAARKRVLRPDLVVLSTGMVPADGLDTLTQTLGVDRDVDGFVDILDRKNRATETSAEGIFTCGSAAGPKALIEVNTEASAVASEIHNFLTSAGRRGTAASRVDASQCVGCDTCSSMCPFNAITLVDRPEWEARPDEVKDDGKLAVIDPESCRACGICAANCPEVAIAHNLSDDALFGRIATMTQGVEKPVVGFYCKECAGAAIGLAGQRRDKYPEGVRLIELPCLGRVSALHIVEAARLGAAGVFLAGCAEGRCQYRSGDTSALEQLTIAEEVLAEGGTPLPLELWHLCAADRMSVGRRIRLFHALAVGEELDEALVAHEMELIGAASAAAVPVREVRAVAAVTEARYPQEVLDAFEELRAECAICYQCGTCTSSCPSGRELYRGPRRIVRLILAGEVEAVLTSDDLWRCTECGTCTEVCRMNIDVAGVLHALRQLERNYGGIRCAERAAADLAGAQLRKRPRIENARFGAAMASKGYVPRDKVGAAEMGLKLVKQMLPSAKKRPAGGPILAGEATPAAGSVPADVTLPFYAGCAIPQDHGLHDVVHEVAAGFGVRLDEATDAGCCGHPSRGSVGSQYATDATVYTACPACDASLVESGIQAVPLWNALTERAARTAGITMWAAGKRFVPYVGCLADRESALAELGEAAEQSGAAMVVDYPTLHNGCCGALGGMYRGATKSSARLLEFAARRPAPVVTTCVLCRDNLRSAARELKLRVPIHFWPEFFRAVPAAPVASAAAAGTPAGSATVPTAPQERTDD